MQHQDGVRRAQRPGRRGVAACGRSAGLAARSGSAGADKSDVCCCARPRTRGGEGQHSVLDGGMRPCLRNNNCRRQGCLSLAPSYSSWRATLNGSVASVRMVSLELRHKTCLRQTSKTIGHVIEVPGLPSLLTGLEMTV